MTNTNETIKMAEKPKKESAIKTWFRENKDIIFGGIMFGLGCIVTGMCMDVVVKKSRSASYLDGYNTGYHDAIDWASFGCDCNKTISCNDFEYAGYGELHDCDADSAEALLNHAESLGLGEDHIKTIRQVIFMEMDKNLPSPKDKMH